MTSYIGDSYYYGLTTDAEFPTTESGEPILGAGALKGLELLGLSPADFYPQMDVVVEMLRSLPEADVDVQIAMRAEHFSPFVFEHLLCKLYRYVKLGNSDILNED